MITMAKIITENITEQQLVQQLEKTSLSPLSGGRGDNVGVERGDNEYLTWEEYFMAVAFITAQRSKDPATQVGYWKFIIIFG